MIDQPVDKPDITLTLDRDGVIRDVSPSDALEHEALDSWRGRPWGETVPSELMERVAQAIDASRRSGGSQCFRVQQLLPSGRELPVEYTTVSLGKKAGFVAIGRNLQTMSDLQSRLSDALKAREQDFWRLRDIEQRYRAILEAYDDAVVLVRASNMRIIEANVHAVRSLGLLPGSEFFPDISGRDRKALDGALELARSQGRALSIALHLQNSSQWSLRASLVTSGPDAFYLLQMSALSAPETASAGDSLDEILHRFPDAFVIVDHEGAIVRTNPTFLDFVQVGVESAAVGQNLKRWLSHPGEDFPVIAGLVQRHGSARRVRSRLEGELGTNLDVEISAVADRSANPRSYGLLMRDVSSREPRSDAAVGEPGECADVGERADDRLDAIVAASVEKIERRHITKALAKFHGNRTMAARHLGLSRQTLHVKLNKYNFD